MAERGETENACGGRNVAAADGVRHPFGVPRLRWFRLQGLRYRFTTCLWSIAPTELPFRNGTPCYRGLPFRFAPAIFNSLPLHRLPVIHRSYGASISRWHAVLQGLCCRSTACLWS